MFNTRRHKEILKSFFTFCIEFGSCFANRRVEEIQPEICRRLSWLNPLAWISKCLEGVAFDCRLKLWRLLRLNWLLLAKDIEKFLFGVYRCLFDWLTRFSSVGCSFELFWCEAFLHWIQPSSEPISKTKGCLSSAFLACTVLGTEWVSLFGFVDVRVVKWIWNALLRKDSLFEGICHLKIATWLFEWIHPKCLLDWFKQFGL